MADDDDVTPPAKDDDTKPTDDKDNLGEGGKKALDAERKARQKAERDLAAVNKRLKDIEDSEKDEVTRLKDQVTDLEKERDAATAERDRIKVAVSKGLSEATARKLNGAARRLHGSTVEELEEDADEYFDGVLLDASEADDTRPPPGGAPRERLKPGNGDDADTPVEEADIRAIGERIFAN
jgi:glycyl-tRNA synthetase beta subunit